MKLGNLLVASLLVLGVSAWAEEGGMPADQGGMPPAQQAEPTPPAEMGAKPKEEKKVPIKRKNKHNKGVHGDHKAKAPAHE
ncbi:MAG: hypothetical protein K1X29_07260 [Bdellovibrionales bacterium]|nr:hypothetical protein [Bdellovibrionales bacterium]